MSSISNTANHKVFKFGFTSDVSTLNLALKFPCTVSIIWKRGEKLAEVKQRKEIVNGVATFNEQLAIECNMLYDPVRKVFETKKTIFSILLFTQKGTKQAGEVEIDVSELLNKRLEESSYQAQLQKCPDKNATLSMKVKAFFKEEIKMDAVSQSSFKTVDVEKVAGTINSSVANFKKKAKIEQVGTSADSQQTVLPSSGLMRSQTKITQNTNTAATEDLRKNLQDQNKKLKEDLKQAKKENEKLKQLFDKSNKTTEDWRNKAEKLQVQWEEAKEIGKNASALEKETKGLEKQVLECRHKLANIFNKAFQLGGPELVDVLQQACGYIQSTRK